MTAGAPQPDEPLMVVYEDDGTAGGERLHCPRCGHSFELRKAMLAAFEAFKVRRPL